METINDYRNERPDRNRNHRNNSRIIIGAILVFAGLALLLRNTALFDPIRHVLFSWQMLLVVIGLVLTLSSSNRTVGIIIMAVGGFLMIPIIFNNVFHAPNMFWPSLLIIAGIIFILTKRRGWNKATSKGSIDEDVIDYVAVFSGGERQVTSQNFKGGKISSVFGGIDLDLTKAKLAPGVNVLEIGCVFGGATIIVPDNWYVKIEVTPVLGGFDDARKLTPGRTVLSDSQLLIKGAVVFGGGEVKSY